MKVKLDAIVTTTLVLCAVIATGVVLRREFIVPATGPAPAEQTPVLIPHWRESLKKGIHIGPAEAPVQRIEFADFECPFCGSFHRTLKTLREHYPTQVSLTCVHFPLP